MSFPLRAKHLKPGDLVDLEGHFDWNGPNADRDAALFCEMGYATVTSTSQSLGLYVTTEIALQMGSLMRTITVAPDHYFQVTRGD